MSEEGNSSVATCDAYLKSTPGARKRRRVEDCSKTGAATASAHEAFADPQASLLKSLSARGASIEHLGSGSWLAILRAFHPSESRTFEDVWSAHPTAHHQVKMYGKSYPLPRWIQAYGAAYKFSGNVAPGIPASPLVRELMSEVNAAFQSGAGSDSAFELNTCLCNWYAPEHYIGLHSDDVRQLIPDSPIASLSWGRTRTFVLKAIDPKHRSLSLDVQDGDLLVMGGSCQRTHRHQVLKLKPGESGNRINFTFRCFQASAAASS